VNCDHRNRRTVIRSRLGTVEQCESCGAAFGDEELARLNDERDLAEEARVNRKLAP
jgi:hypothetical protein